MVQARKQLSKKTRFDVFKRDGFVCQYCGDHPPSVVLQVDHIVAVAAGGGNDIDNLITSCWPCNIGKGANDLRSIPKSLKDRAAEIAEREEQLRGYQALLESRRERLEEECWRVIEVLTGAEEVKGSMFLSVQRFIERLGLHSVLDAAEISASRYGIARNERSVSFRYFCGICWGRIRDENHG